MRAEKIKQAAVISTQTLTIFRNFLVFWELVKELFEKFGT
jgi:hypothetical protein